MVVLAACLVYVVTVTAAGPLLLTSGQWQVWYPRLALACWHLALASSAAVLIFGVGFAIIRASAGESGRQGLAALLPGLAIWLMLFVVGALSALFLGQSEHVVRQEHSRRDELRDALHGCAREAEIYDGLTVHYLDDISAVACSFRAPEPTVVLTSGLRAQLTRPQLDAVIEHERAHLDQRHHFALLLAGLNRACLPRFGPARRLDRMTRLLVELIADDESVRRCGRDTVASALAAIAQLTANPGLAARSERVLAATK
ncbi:M56 family metallopeptidase [Kribbella sp. NBC_00709]|uniref:M56 family metallopeptidase n=1 Tax=Kribbella sp. NBC_00709 TaxID=2975972 RepID=UPI002E2A0F80|nr:M56 family metallopeptidase [Kribbella sp. NBC_00709]